MYSKQTRRFIGSVPDTTSNHFITKALAKQSFQFHKKLSHINFRLLIAFFNRQRRMKNNAQRSDNRQCKCGIIVMVSHRIRSGQDTEWRQDNEIGITLREKRTIVAKRHRPAAAVTTPLCICFDNVLAPSRSGINLLVAGPDEQSPVNQPVPFWVPPHSRVSSKNPSGPISE